MARAVGIDLQDHELRRRHPGGGEPVVIPDAEDRGRAPSVVGFSKPSGPIVGEVAKRRAMREPGPDGAVGQATHGGQGTGRSRCDGKDWSPQESPPNRPRS